jgi:hypothetical protein
MRNKGHKKSRERTKERESTQKQREFEGENERSLTEVFANGSKESAAPTARAEESFLSC